MKRCFVYFFGGIFFFKGAKHAFVLIFDFGFIIWIINFKIKSYTMKSTSSGAQSGRKQNSAAPTPTCVSTLNFLFLLFTYCNQK